MSTTRCGLEVSRNTTITNEVHDWPRSKQMECLISGTVMKKPESKLTEDVVEDEFEDQMELAEAEKSSITELSLRDAGSSPLAKGVIPELSGFTEAEVNIIEPMIEEGLSRGLSRKQAISRAKKILEEIKEKGQKGKGVFSILRRLAKIPFAKTIALGALAGVSNLFPDSDENARNIFPGEFHAIVKLPNDKFGRANYTGPGTRIVERLKRGDPPRVLSDKVSQAHDIRYGLAKNEDDVRIADQKMLRGLERLKREGTDRGLNITPAMSGIRGKVLAENFGLLSRSAFIDDDFKPKPEGVELMKSKLKELEQQGFGHQRVGSRLSKLIGQRNQALQISPPGGNVRRLVIPVRNSLPQAWNPGSGQSATQNLVGKYTPDSQRGIPQVDRRQSRSLAEALSVRGLNTRGQFANANFQTSAISMSAGGENPAETPTAGSEKINIQTRKQTPFNPSSRMDTSKLTKNMAGLGWPGVNPIDVQTGAGRKLIDPPQFPGSRLVSKIQKKIKRRGLQAMPARRPAKRPRKIHNKNPLFMNDHAMAGFLADKMMPLVMAR